MVGKCQWRNRRAFPPIYPSSQSGRVLVLVEVVLGRQAVGRVGGVDRLDQGLRQAHQEGEKEEEYDLLLKQMTKPVNILEYFKAQLGVNHILFMFHYSCVQANGLPKTHKTGNDACPT